MEWTLNPTNDFMFWSANLSGKFTSKSAYDFLINHQQDASLPQDLISGKVFKILWHLPRFPKWKFFIWRLFYDRLPTRDRLHLRNNSDSSYWDVCKTTIETFKHLFLLCPIARGVWQHFHIDIQTQHDNPSSHSEWLINYILLLSSEDRL